jgi:hypothetical protein
MLWKFSNAISNSRGIEVSLVEILEILLIPALGCTKTAFHGSVGIVDTEVPLNLT